MPPIPTHERPPEPHRGYEKAPHEVILERLDRIEETLRRIEERR
tara:strand:+ start:10638 stop:10769 length:132 start_codon:yes stop_codon:yes gene_type:complete